MDLSYWNNLNSNIKFTASSKKFFNKFLYRLTIDAPGGRLIQSPRESIEEGIEIRQQVSSYQRSSWNIYYRRDDSIQRADAKILERLRTLRNANLDTIRIRIEEPKVQIYFNDITVARDIITKYFINSDYDKFIEICGPESAAAEAILNSGSIVRKTAAEYKYKVIFRDGQYDVAVKESILAYIDGLGTETAKITLSCRRMLASSGRYMWNCYFFTNDAKCNSFIEIISPGIILNCHELVTV